MMSHQKTVKDVTAEKFRDKDFIKIIVLEKKFHKRYMNGLL